MALVELLIGAALGVAAERAASYGTKTLQNYRNAKTLARRRDLLQPKQISDWLLRYHEVHGSSADLFHCKIGSFEIPIPFLTQSSWQWTRTIGHGSDDLLRYARTDALRFDIDLPAISRRDAIGQRIFDEPALYLDYVSFHGSDPPEFHVKTCRYYEIATNLIRLEEEAMTALMANKVTNLRYRDGGLMSLKSATLAGLKPLPLGCATVMAFRVNGSYELVLHVRSSSTITFGGVEAVSPTFGLAPVLSAFEKVDRSLIFYNFVREYLEELFDYEELVQVVKNRRADPDWIFNLPESKLLFQSAGFTLECLGAGFNAFNGSLQFALLARVEDQEAASELKRRIKANWEVAQSDLDSSTMRFIDWKSFELEEKLRQRTYNPASAYALARALQRLRKLEKEREEVSAEKRAEQEDAADARGGAADPRR